MNDRQSASFVVQLASFGPPLVTFIFVVALWEGLVWAFALPQYLLPAPGRIAAAFMEQPDNLLGIGLVTFSNALVGFMIGCGLGALVATFCVRWSALADGLVPFAIASNAVPIVALSPLLGVWLGSVSPASKIGVVAVMTFFPTLVNVYRGLISPGHDALQLMHSYAARQRDIFFKLRLPAALPFLFNALKICATLSMIGAVVAEFFGGPRRALGVYILSEASLGQYADAWAAILVACIYGIAFYLLISVAERWFMRWQRK